MYIYIFFFFKEWKSKNCDSKIKSLGNDGKEDVLECLCNGLHPTTIISDIEGIFKTSEID